jgi:Chalcone isomerase-like
MSKRLVVPTPDNLRRQLMMGGAALALTPWMAPAEAAVELENVEVEETAMVAGRKLVLNGVGLRRRGYFKADVTSLYLPERRSNADSIMKLDGPRRIQLNILRDFSSSTISRIFISDFKQATTEEEFKKLIDVVAQLGAVYNTIKKINKGDVVKSDWTPGKGWSSTINNKPIVVESESATTINNELAFQVYLRMFIGPNAPDELRSGLLGLTKPNKV